jgi:shikimate dehydrogenase
LKNSDGTQLYGLIGHPVAHSLSPFMMNRAFRLLDIDAAYLRFDVSPDRLDRAVDALTALGAKGANVTYPFKNDILRFVDVPSPDAELIGAVNTLAFHDDQIIGHNTDASGAAAALGTFGGIHVRETQIFIFGGGASGRAAALGLLRESAAAVTFAVRSTDGATPFIESLRRAFPGRTVQTVALTGEGTSRDRRRLLESADVVINATPVGMGGRADTSFLETSEWIQSRQCFFDFVYNPGYTAFLNAAAARGARVLGGLSLLVCQAVESFRLWTGRSFDARAMYEVLEAAFPERAVG